MALLWMALGVGCTGGGGIGECELDPVTVPAELGITDDDADWLCGEDRPERAQNHPDFGITAAGVETCFPGEDGTIAGSDIYVATDGDDGNDGTSAASPLATLATALCHAGPGQTIHLAPGTYADTSVLVAALGTAGSDTLTIRGDGSTPEDVILDGSYWRSFAIGLVESHHVVVTHLTVQHYTDNGIYTLLGSDLTFDDIVSRNNGRCSVERDSEGEGFGINLVGTDDIAVVGSVFEDNGPLLEPVTCGLVLGTGINTFEVNGEVRDNTIRRTRGGAMLIEDGGDVTLTGNVAEDNYLLAVGNYWDAALWIDGSTDITVRDNTFTDNWGGAGVMVTDEEGVYPTAATGTVITGNTISGHAAGVLVWGYGECPPPSDAIDDYATLADDNDLAGNSWQGDDTGVLCDPDFVGGELP